MNILEAKHILKSVGYSLLREAVFSDENSEYILDELKNIVKPYEERGYTVTLHPSTEIKYYVNLGFDPTIGAEYESPRYRDGVNYNYDIFKKGFKNLAKTKFLTLRFVKPFTKEYINYVKFKLHSNVGDGYGSSYCNNFIIEIPIIIDKDSENEITWTINRTKQTGTFNDFANAIATNIKEYEAALKASMYKEYKDNLAYHNKYKLSYDHKTGMKNISRSSKNKLYKNITNILSAATNRNELINAFNRAYDISPDATSNVCDSKLIDKVDSYVYDNYSDEDGECANWVDGGKSANEYIQRFVDYLESEYNGDVKKLFDEYDINTLEDLQDFVAEGDFEFPSESDVWPPYD